MNPNETNQIIRRAVDLINGSGGLLKLELRPYGLISGDGSDVIIGEAKYRPGYLVFLPVGSTTVRVYPVSEAKQVDDFSYFYTKKYDRNLDLAITISPLWLPEQEKTLKTWKAEGRKLDDETIKNDYLRADKVTWSPSTERKNVPVKKYKAVYYSILDSAGRLKIVGVFVANEDSIQFFILPFDELDQLSNLKNESLKDAIKRNWKPLDILQYEQDNGNGISTDTSIIFETEGRDIKEAGMKALLKVQEGIQGKFGS